MPSNTIAEILKDLQKFYSKPLNPTQLEFYINSLRPLDEDDLCKAVIALKAKEVILPTVSIIRKYLNEAREQRLQSEKERAPIFADIKRNAQQSSSGKDAIELMQSLFDHKINRDQYLAGMYAMEEKYPGRGWQKNADELKEFYASEEERHAKSKIYLERISIERFKVNIQES